MTTLYCTPKPNFILLKPKMNHTKCSDKHSFNISVDIRLLYKYQRLIVQSTFITSDFTYWAASKRAIKIPVPNVPDVLDLPPE